MWTTLYIYTIHTTQHMHTHFHTFVYIHIHIHVYSGTSYKGHFVLSTQYIPNFYAKDNFLPQMKLSYNIYFDTTMYTYSFTCIVYTQMHTYVCFRHSLSSEVIDFIHRKGCIMFWMRNTKQTIDQPPLDVVESIATIFSCLKDSTEISQVTESIVDRQG